MWQATDPPPKCWNAELVKKNGYWIVNSNYTSITVATGPRDYMATRLRALLTMGLRAYGPDPKP